MSLDLRELINSHQAFNSEEPSSSTAHLQSAKHLPLHPERVPLVGVLKSLARISDFLTKSS